MTHPAEPRDAQFTAQGRPTCLGRSLVDVRRNDRRQRDGVPTPYERRATRLTLDRVAEAGSVWTSDAKGRTSNALCR